MKTIAIVTDSSYKSGRPNSVGEIIRANLNEVFAHQVEVQNYYIDQIHNQGLINGDLIMVMASSRTIKIKDHVTDPNNIIIVKRTFQKSGINQLFSIPKGSDVLVVNPDIETVLDSISTLYHIGIKHVNLIPFEKGKAYHHIQYALSPAETQLVPEYIPHQFDVKARVIDIPTMLLIMSKLQISDKQTQQNLYTYYQKILSSNEGITNNYNDLMIRTEELDYLLNLSHDGILLTDKNGKILIANKKFKDIFELADDVIGQTLDNLLSEINPQKYYTDESHDDLVIFHKKSINLRKQDIVHFNNEIRMYFTFQEVTYIKKLEQNLSKKLRQKGHIARYSFADIISSSESMADIIKKAKKIAKTDLTVLITGENGTGKEVLAQAIHNASNRANQPFIAINGAAIPDNLLESELFGYVSGSFTGALKGGKKGLFEHANNGTIFLDEIGDMPNYLQSKLLRVLQERQISPIGSDTLIDIDVRVIAATNKNPMEMIELGSFRKDLFYRLSVFPIELPPLNQRREDIPALIEHFTEHPYTISAACLDLLTSYHWPGNIRELSNIVQYISTISESDLIDVSDLPLYLQNYQSPDSSKIRRDELILSLRSDQNTSFAVLEAIRVLNEIGKTAGRKHLIEVLSKTNFPISEGVLRNILTKLQESKLIVVKKGRSGSFLTDKGYNMIRRNS